MTIHHLVTLGLLPLPVPGLYAQAAAAEISPVELLQRRSAAQGAMDDLISALRQIRTTGQVEPSLPTLAAAVARYHEQIAPIMESGSADLPPVTRENLDFHERNRALFRRSREQQAELSRILVVDFISLLYGSELLCYHLLLQSPYLELPLSEECRELLTMHLAMTAQADLEQRQPQAVLDLFAEAAGRHSDFLRTHADCYSGGDGSGAASPILLHLDGESASNEQMEMSLIRAYHSTVYPGTCTTCVTCMAGPDGSAYTMLVRFPGLYTAPDGSQKLLRHVIWFRMAT